MAIAISSCVDIKNLPDLSDRSRIKERKQNKSKQIERNQTKIGLERKSASACVERDFKTNEPSAASSASEMDSIFARDPSLAFFPCSSRFFVRARARTRSWSAAHRDFLPRTSSPGSFLDRTMIEKLRDVQISADFMKV